jgi:hypothetical protein
MMKKEVMMKKRESGFRKLPRKLVVISIINGLQAMFFIALGVLLLGVGITILSNTNEVISAVLEEYAKTAEFNENPMVLEDLKPYVANAAKMFIGFGIVVFIVGSLLFYYTMKLIKLSDTGRKGSAIFNGVVGAGSLLMISFSNPISFVLPMIFLMFNLIIAFILTSNKDVSKLFLKKQ